MLVKKILINYNLAKKNLDYQLANKLKEDYRHLIMAMKRSVPYKEYFDRLKQYPPIYLN